MSDLATFLRKLDETKADTAAAGREAFRRQAGNLLEFTRLSNADEQTALEYIKAIEATLSVRLNTSGDMVEAAQICRGAAARLRTAPWFAEVTHHWPAPIAHEGSEGPTARNCTVAYCTQCHGVG